MKIANTATTLKHKRLSNWDWWLGWFYAVIAISALTAMCSSWTWGAVARIEDMLPESRVILDVYNPYSFTAEIEVKCDWNGRKWGYHNLLIVKKKGRTSLVVPHTQEHCEIWPKIKFF